MANVADALKNDLDLHQLDNAESKKSPRAPNARQQRQRNTLSVRELLLLQGLESAVKSLPEFICNTSIDIQMHDKRISQLEVLLAVQMMLVVLLIIYVVIGG